MIFYNILGPMCSSSVFIEMMICALYGQKCKHPKTNYGKKSLNVPTVKLFSNFFFNVFGVFSCFIVFTRYSWRSHVRNVWKLTTNIMKIQELKNENAPLERILNYCKRQQKLPFTVNIVLLLCHTVLWNVYEFNFKELRG